MTAVLHVLLIEDSQDDALLIEHELRRGGYTVVAERVATAPELLAALSRRKWDLVTCDYVLPGFSAEAALEIIRAHGDGVPVIVVSGEVGEEIAVGVMKAGANDFVSKHKLTRLIPGVERELREAEGRRARACAVDALRRSQADLQAILNNTLQSFLLMDCDGRIVAFNQIASVRSELLLLGPPLAAGQLITEIIPTDQAAQVRDSFDRALAGEVVVAESKVDDAQGTEHWLEFNYIPVREENNAITGVCLSVMDTTEHRRSVEALRRTEERLRTYIEQATDLIFTLNASGQVTSVNRAVCETTGYASEELIGKVPLDLVAPESLTVMQALLHQVLEGGAVERAEVEIVRKDGQHRWLEVRGRTIYESGRMIETFHIARDITDRRSADAERARLSAAVEQAAESVMITDRLGCIVYVNPACERMTGYARAELYGQHPSLLNGHPFNPEDERELRETLERGDVWRGSAVQRSKNGALYEVDVVISPVFDASRRIINYVGLARNPTNKAAPPS